MKPFIYLLAFSAVVGLVGALAIHLPWRTQNVQWYGGMIYHGFGQKDPSHPNTICWTDEIEIGLHTNGTVVWRKKQ